MSIDSPTPEPLQSDATLRRDHDYLRDVDVAIRRVGETLADYEQLIARFEQRIRKSPLPPKDPAAIYAPSGPDTFDQMDRQRSLVDNTATASQTTENPLSAIQATGEPKSSRHQMADSARNDLGLIEEILERAHAKAKEIKQEADAMIRSLMSNTETQLTAILKNTHEEAESLISDAALMAKTKTRMSLDQKSAEDIVAAALTEALDRIETSKVAAESMLDAAAKRANDIVAGAQKQNRMLGQRVAELTESGR